MDYKGYVILGKWLEAIGICLAGGLLVFYIVFVLCLWLRCS